MVVNEKNKQFNLAWEDFSGADYCQTKCEFYNTCRGDREICPKNVFKKMLGTLTETEEAALKLSFGFCDNKQLPLQEVADYLNLTPEQVRQVTAKALRKLRHPARSHVILKNKSDYQSKNGVLYSADGRQLIYLPPSRYNKTVEILEGVYELCKESCCFVSAKEILFPKSLRRVDDCACCGSDLGKSKIPACDIGESAFQGCVLPEFTEIYNEVIPVKAFANCSGVKMIRLYDSVKLVKNEAFSYTNIDKIYIPPSTQIEENAFVHEVTKWIGSHVAKVHENGLKQMKSTYETCLENNKDITIGGEAGSPAEAFANANGIKFEVVGSSDEEIKAWFGWQERIDEPRGSGVFYETSYGELAEFDKDNLPF